jgi:RHS repeat-associated protein
VLVGKYLYDPYGNILSRSGPLADANLYRFSSKEFHVASGLVYYLYRSYDSNLQRWLNRDPVEEFGGINLYCFVLNDPANLIDPFGESFWEFFWKKLIWPFDNEQEFWDAMGECAGMCGAMPGGGKNATKISKFSLEKGKEIIANLRRELARLRSLANKTPETKEAIERAQKVLNKAIDKAKQCEEHSRTPKH